MVKNYGPELIDEESPMEERRELRRIRADRAAKIVAAESALLGCTVHDINSAGACLSVPEMRELPDEVELTLDGGRTYRFGRIVWRGAARAGMKFGD